MAATEIENCVNLHFREGDIVSTEDKRLTLAYEGLVEVPQNLLVDYGSIIEVLDLSHNKISNVDFLSKCQNLTTLILDHNLITAETSFPSISSLTMLWLNHNLILKTHPLLPNLSKSYPNLTCLSLMGNQGAPSYLTGGTYYEYLKYRLFAISWLSKLEYLDDRRIADDQREEAKRLYGRTFYQSLPSPQQYFVQIQNKWKQLINSINLGKPLRDFTTSLRMEPIDGIRVEDFGNIHADSSSSSLNNSLSITNNSRSRNLVI